MFFLLFLFRRLGRRNGAPRLIVSSRIALSSLLLTVSLTVTAVLRSVIPVGLGGLRCAACAELLAVLLLVVMVRTGILRVVRSGSGLTLSSLVLLPGLILRALV